MLTLFRRLSWRHVVRSPLRAALVVGGIALAVALQVATQATSESLVTTFETMVEHVSGKADATIHGRGTPLAGDLSADVLEVPGVAHASGLLEVPLRDPADGRPLLILGVDFLGDPYFLPFDVEAGEHEVIEDPLAFVNDPHAVLLSEAYAQRRGLEVGDPLPLMGADGPMELRVRGVLAGSGPAAAFDGQVAVMFLDAAQVAFARGHTVDRIQVALAPDADRGATLERVGETVGERGTVEPPEQRRQRVIDLLDPIRAVLSMAGVLALVVAMFLIYNAVAIAVAQRRYEIGVARALGATRSAVVAIFCAEALLLAVPAVAIGVGAGRWFARIAVEQTVPAISQLYLPLRPSPPELEGSMIARAVGAALAATLVAALLPALRAARVDPALAMRGRGRAASRRHLPHRALAVAGATIAAVAWTSTSLQTVPAGLAAAPAVLLAAALWAPAFLVGMRALLIRPRLPLGASIKLGLVNARRDLGRSAISIVALTVAVALSLALGAWRQSMEDSITGWFDESLSGDLVVSAGSPLNDQYNVPFSPDVVTRVQELPGVAAALPYRFSTQTFEGLEHIVSGFDTELHARLQAERGRDWTLVDGTAPLDATELTTGRRVLLSEAAARHLGLGAGDGITLRTPDGPREFEVRAVIGDYFLDRPAILLDRRHMVEVLGDPRIDSIDVFVAPDAREKEVAERLRAHIGGGEALFVTRAKELRTELAGTVERSFRYARSIEWVALVIALMGVLGTMLAVVLDRTGELGTLRAIGASRGQVAAAVTAEAAVLGFAAAVLGVAAGALLGAVLVHGIVAPGTEWDLTYVFPTADALRIAALVVITAALAGLLPAHRAARVDVPSALAGD